MPPRQPDLVITDEKIFERLTEAGLNLQEEAIVGAFLYFPSEAPARRAATQLEASGFAAFADPSPPTRWLVETEVKTIPTPEYIAEMAGKLRTVASAHGGAYDGWWAVEPPDEEELAARAAAASVEAVTEPEAASAEPGASGEPAAEHPSAEAEAPE